MNTKRSDEGCADCGRPLDGDNCTAGGVHDIPSVEKESWEDEFDEKFGTDYGWEEGGYGSRLEKKIKDFIKQTLQADRQAIREWITENEYCSNCCSPRKFCPKWGKDPSAIDTEDLLKFLSDNKEKIK